MVPIFVLLLNIKQYFMESVLITSQVIDTIKSLPLEQREAIASAVAGVFILGDDYKRKLSPYQEMLFSIISFYVKRDTKKYRQSRYMRDASEII